MDVRLPLATTWDGVPIPVEARAMVEVMLEAGALTVRVEAPFAGDPAPVAPPGRTDRLWEHEVVELFLAEAPTREARYLELELGPHGHWLALGLAGYRQRVIEDVAVSFEARILGERWAGVARVSASEMKRVGAGVGAVNAYAIRGVGDARRFFAAAPAPAGRFAGPDFHRLELFRAL